MQFTIIPAKGNTLFGLSGGIQVDTPSAPAVGDVVITADGLPGTAYRIIALVHFAPGGVLQAIGNQITHL